MQPGWQDTPEARERLRVVYCETTTPIAALCTTFLISSGRLYRIANQEGWPRRSLAPQPCGHATGKAPGGAGDDLAPGETGPMAFDRHALALRMERFIGQRIATLETDIAAKPDHDPEKLGRAMTHMARSLAIIQAYRVDLEKERVIDEADVPPRSLSELRDELRRHLGRIRDEERARRCDRPDGAA